MVKASSIQVSEISWKPAWRIVSTTFADQDFFDDLAPEEDFEVLYALDELTSDRTRHSKEMIRWPHTMALFFALNQRDSMMNRLVHFMPPKSMRRRLLKPNIIAND